MTQAPTSDNQASSDIVFLEDAGGSSNVVLPRGELCQACGTPLDADDRFCPACGKVHEVARSKESSDSSRHIKCESCGAQIETQQDQRSYVCPFCESTYVLEVPETEDRPRPEFVIGFAVTPEQAEQRFMEWISEKSWFRPSDLALARPAERLRGVYLPFWHFAMLAHSQWQASIGEHWYRTETYTTTGANGKSETRTRQVQETEWWPLQGRHHRYYSGYMVSAAKGLSQAEADSVMPFQLAALKRFEPGYLAGWLAEEATVSKEQALVVCKQFFASQEQRNVAAFMPGDTHRSLSVSTNFDGETSDLCLLPVYVMNYQYKGKPYRFVVNGQTGRINGKRPYSPGRIALAIALGVGGALLLVGMFLLIMAVLGAMNS